MGTMELAAKEYLEKNIKYYLENEHRNSTSTTSDNQTKSDIKEWKLTSGSSSTTSASALPPNQSDSVVKPSSASTATTTSSTSAAAALNFFAK